MMLSWDFIFNIAILQHILFLTNVILFSDNLSHKAWKVKIDTDIDVLEIELTEWKRGGHGKCLTRLRMF